MELATIYLHSLKAHTKIHKIFKFGVNRLNNEQDITISKCQNCTKNVWPAGRCRTAVRQAIHIFVKF